MLHCCFRLHYYPLVLSTVTVSIRRLSPLPLRVDPLTILYYTAKGDIGKYSIVSRSSADIMLISRKATPKGISRGSLPRRPASALHSFLCASSRPSFTVQSQTSERDCELQELCCLFRSQLSLTRRRGSSRLSSGTFLRRRDSTS